VPRDLWQQVPFLIRDNGLGPDDYLFQSRNGGKLSKRSAREVVERTALYAHAQTSDDDLLSVLSHDLRRFWANKVPNELNVNPRIVMEMGGWSSFNSMKPYIQPATPETIAKAMVSAGNE
jgi:integrase